MNKLQSKILILQIFIYLIKFKGGLCMNRLLVILLCLTVFSSVILAETNEEELFAEEQFFKVEEQIVVSASKRAQKLSDAPVSISVITADDIKKLGVQSIAEALRMVPGVYVQEALGGQQEVAIRGMINSPKEAGPFAVYSRNILVMIDGRSYFNDVFGGTFWELLPITTDDIDRIEVVRGPSSALFGANAVTGVINIITKDFGKTKGGQFSTSIGDNGQQLHSFRYGDDGKNFSYRISGEYSHKDILDDKSYNHTYDKYMSGRESLLADPENNFPKNPDFPAMKDDALDVYRISSFLNYKINQKLNLNLQLGRSEGSMNLSGTSGDLLLSGYDKVENNVAKFTMQYDNFKISVSNIQGQLGDEVKAGKGNELTQQDGMDWNSIDVDAQNVFTVTDKDVLVAGVNWREVKSNSDDIYFRDLEEKSQKFSAAFFNNEYKFSDKVKWVAGTRYDKYDTPDKAKWSPQTILFYKPKENHTFRLIYSQAIRAPFIVDLFTNAQFSAGNIVNPLDPDYGKLAPIIKLMSNEELNPMTIKSYELGYSTLLQDKINLDVNVYHYIVDDLIGYSITTNDSFATGSIPKVVYAGGTAIPFSKDNCSAVNLQSVNLSGQLKSDGIELGLNYNVSKDWRIWGNYSYENSTFQDKHSNAAPAHLASFGSFKNLKNGWNLAFSVNYVSASEVTVTNIMDQTLAQINKDLAANPTQFFTEALTGADAYKKLYLEQGAYIYESLNGRVLNDTDATQYLTAMGLQSSVLPLWSVLTDTQASFIATAGGAPLSIPGGVDPWSIPDTITLNGGGLSLYDTQVGAAAARAVNGELYKVSSQKESTQRVDEYMFLNFRLAKRILNNNGEIAFIGSIRPDKREYPYGEKTGNKFRASLSYRF